MSDSSGEFRGDPNSQNQRWSRWTFGVEPNVRRLPSYNDLKINFARWASAGFKTDAARARVDQYTSMDRRRRLDLTMEAVTMYYEFTVEVEGPPAHDPEYADSVRRDFIRKMVEGGFGSGASLVKFEVGLLAGSREDGSPADQLLVMPTIDMRAQLHDLTS